MVSKHSELLQLRNLKKLAFIVVILISSLQFSLFSEDFSAVSDIWTPFFMESEEGYTGIGHDILTEITKRTGDSVEFIRVPNKRAFVMFKTDLVDMMVIDSPLWSDPEKSSEYVFTHSLMTVKEYVYTLANSRLTIFGPEDLFGKKISFIGGYQYPVLDEAFRSGKISTIEVRNENSLLQMLLLGRVDAILMDSIAFAHAIADAGYGESMFIRGMQLSETALGIKIRREKEYIIPRFNSAISSMKKDGTLDKIIEKYLGPNYE